VTTGEGGSDLIIGGSGNDVLESGHGFDRLEGGDAAGDILLNIENVIGSRFSDTLIGDAGVNTLEGMAGNDSLSAGHDRYADRGGGCRPTVRRQRR
jgi:Ca2+-binding RTX toxin-like protein